jgi:CheY-like chemotaxis protein
LTEVSQCQVAAVRYYASAKSTGELHEYTKGRIAMESKIYNGMYSQSVSDTAGVQGGRLGRPAPIGGSETILAVEDNAGLRRVVVRQLGQAGYRVLEAPDADAAIALIESAEPIQLLLTDVVMPGGMNGSDLAEVAVARRPSLLTLFTSGYPDVTLGGSERNNRLLSKPYRREELLRAVREILDDQR